MSAVRVREADFAVDEAAIRGIRFAVFVDEQRVPANLEMDERDAACAHVLALVEGQPVGTGRLDAENDGKIGRVAVLASARRQGVGRAVMARLHEAARQRGLTEVWCHAQVAAVPFYERLGYRVVGGVFDEAGIDHVRMERPIDRMPAL
jgi:predicted GNAT family N-acyltransferase